MTFHVCEPAVGFGVQAKSGAVAGPRELLADIDLLLRFAFIELNFNSDGGLLISADGKPWNTPKHFDTQENVTSWFESIAELASGATEPLFVWAWEESNCTLTPIGTNLVQLEDNFFPTVVFGKDRLLRQFAAAGRALLDLQDAVHRRIEQLLSEKQDRGVPRTAWQWSDEVPRQYLRKRVVRTTGHLAFTEGMTVKDGWLRVLKTRYSPERRYRIRRALDLVEAQISNRL